MTTQKKKKQKKRLCSRLSNERFNFTCYCPSRSTPGTSPVLRARGWGIVLRVSRGYGGGANINILIPFDFAKYVLFLARFTR